MPKPKTKSTKEALSEQPPRDPVYMNTVQAAEYVGLSTQWLEIARYKADGTGPSYVKLARAVRYKVTTLDAWMASHTKGPTDPATPARQRTDA